MAESQDFSQEAKSDSPESQDEFASGQANQLRILTARLVRQILSPPYFPSELTWCLLAIIATTLAVQILPQPSAYWIDPELSPF